MELLWFFKVCEDWVEDSGYGILDEYRCVKFSMLGQTNPKYERGSNVPTLKCLKNLKKFGKADFG